MRGKPAADTRECFDRHSEMYLLKLAMGIHAYALSEV